MRVSNSVERDVFPDPCLVIAVPANTNTEVLKELRRTRGEWAGRYIQNVGANPCFYAFGQDCDGATNYHGILAASQQLDCSNHPASVKVFSVAGTTIATTTLRRNDNYTQQNIATGNMTMP